MSKLQALRAAFKHPLMLSLYMPSLLIYFAAGMIVPVLPLYASSFDVSYGVIGLVLAGEGIGLLLSDVPAGMLLRRFGQRRVMLIGLGIIALVAAGMAAAQSVLALLLLQMLGGFGRALYNISRHAYISDRVRTARRGRAIAIYGGVFRIGWFVGPAVGGTLAALLGLRAPFLLMSLVSVLALLVTMRYMQNVPLPPATGERAAPVGHLWHILREHYRALATAGLGQIFVQMIRSGRGVMIPLYGADVLGLDAQAIGFILSLSSGLDMLLFYPAGWIMDNLGRRYAIVPSFVIQAAGMALIPFTTAAGGLLAAACIIGLGNGISSGSMMTIGSDLAPVEGRGEFLGLWRLLGDSGVMGAPLAVGAIADLVRLGPAALVLALCGLVGAGIFGLLVPETLQRPQPAPQPPT